MCTGWIGSQIEDQRKEYDKHYVNDDGCNYAEMQEYVLNLSISLRTGKETNLDFVSSGERTRKSSNGNIFRLY